MVTYHWQYTCTALAGVTLRSNPESGGKWEVKISNLKTGLSYIIPI